MGSIETALPAEQAAAPLEASADALGEPTYSDARLRRRLFWFVLGISAALAVFSYWLQQRYSYDLNPPAPLAGRYQSRPPRYGSYGLSVARTAPAPAPTTTVAILSNSVYVTCGVAEQMQTWANDEGSDLRFLNFAQTGSGIHDHLLQMPLALQARPQLVVIAFINLAFTPRNGARSLPKFRTDIDQTAFDPCALRVLPLSLYWREFTLNEGGSAALATIWPAKRLDWLLRRDLDQFVTTQLGRPPAWFEHQFPLPTLNLAADWLRVQETDATLPTSQPAFPESSALLHQLVDLARSRGVGLLLLRQESGPFFDTPEIWPLVQQACSSYERAFAVDLKAAFDPEQIKDQVHPVPGVARLEYAKRHYRVILDVVERMELQPGPSGAGESRQSGPGARPPAEADETHMLFNSWAFVLFFIVLYLLYLRLCHRAQNWLLLAASYVFYGAWDWRFLGLLFLSTVVDYYCGLWIARARSIAVRRGILIASVGVSLSILGFFKYCDFFLENLIALLHAAGLNPALSTLNIILPVGISFYTFQTMSYTIDVYRGRMAPCARLSDFALFVSFFPQLVAGPIERATNLVHQVVQPRVLHWPQVRSGLWLLVQGYFLKVVIADNAAPIADAAFNAPTASGGTALLGIYAFALQIYCDFAGYSTIARGLAKLMGFELMVNFRQPYLAVSPSDFWQRWHISLSSWLRDYLYIPLGGNRSGPAQTYRNLLLTMLLGGLWHGAQWRFVIWGLYHGLLLVLFRRAVPSRPADAGIQWLRPLRAIAFFQLTCFGWLIFRCNSIAQIWTYPAAIFGNLAWSPANQETLWTLLFLGLPVLVLDLVDEYGLRATPREAPRALRPLWRWMRTSARLGAALYMLAMLFVCGARGGTQFIYFQF